MKAKKIDEYNARKILYSNKNLFKEIDYELKKDMEFEEKNELNCQKICFYRGIPIVAIYISYKFIYLAISCFFNNKLGLFNILKIIVLILFGLLLTLIKDVKRTINNIFSLRIFIYLVHYFDLFLFCKLSTGNDNFSGNNTDHFLSLSTFVNTYLLIIMINYVFSLGYKKCVILTLLNCLFIMAFYDHKNLNIFKRLFLNLFSFRFIISMFYSIVTLLIQKSINKPVKKLWALYDSFKKLFKYKKYF